MSWDHFRDILPLLTLALGYLGSLWNEDRRERRQARDRRSAAVEELQQQTRLDLQDGLREYLLAVTQVIRWYEFAIGTPLPRQSEADQAEHEARTRVFLLASRLLDDETRALVGDVYEEVALLMAEEDDLSRFEDLAERVHESYAAAMQALGEQVRQSDRL